MEESMAPFLFVLSKDDNEAATAKDMRSISS
jgi:hypothetical protein